MAPKQHGFTLVELMIVVAIVGILTMIVLPIYQDSFRKSRRVDAEAYLMDLAQRQQQYFTDNRAYAATPAALQDAVPATVSPYYTVTIVVPANATPPTFSITAQPINSQSADSALSIDNTGAKSPAGYW